ncbi:MAG TPA: cytidine deaminase, partial [Longimicrobium sp.]|nr:cytidine deaminase [Longimicrobium sp.]
MFYAARSDSLTDSALSATALDRVRQQLESTPGYIPADVVKEILEWTGMTIEEYLTALVPVAAQMAIPPISNFKVGAAGQGASGSVYLGANMEYVGQALSMCVHGEQAVTANAISHGETGLPLLAISAAPCGYCRQFLYETTTASKLQILLSGKPAVALTTLLPQAFGPSDLGVDAALMSPQAHGLTLSGGGGAVAQAALAAANASYAPYSFSYSGVGLGTSSGAVFSGSYAENAAFNPSMSPLEAALVSLVMGGGSFGEITEAVLVQVQGAIVSQ